MESQQAQSQPVQQQPRAPGRRWGITLPLQGSPLAAQREMVAALPALGYTDAWSAEVSGVDAFTPLALASQWTSELRFGTAITSVYTRAPGVLAMSAATIADLAPGRFVLGIGTSSQIVVEQWNGIPFEKPYHRAADMLRFLRAALAREAVRCCAEAACLPHGAPVRLAGLVLVRQRPGNGNVVFCTVEDETGIANLVIWASLLDRFRRAILASRLLLVAGRVQRSTENVVHIIAERLEDRSAALAALAELPGAIMPRSRDFH